MALGKTAGVMLRIDQTAVLLHVKNAVAAFDQLDSSLGEMQFDLALQTGRLRPVISLHAVFDGNTHLSVFPLTKDSTAPPRNSYSYYYSCSNLDQ